MKNSKLQVDSRAYLCLRCAGFLEQLVFLTVKAFLVRTASGPALAFSRSFFRQAPNLTAAALDGVFERFGSEHKVKLSSFMTIGRHDTLSDLMSIRNLVAHGQLVGSGAKLDPTRYVKFCGDFYLWCVEMYFEE
ncbi:hypothetical protein [Salinibacterium sp.]|uniref:hypothetical protein n=1 Tax=Salinibacterium sp. TaxID=1915057 RepID=UPI00286C317C|nr:hypothetical protein [Salinibacterium sp.]